MVRRVVFACVVLASVGAVVAGQVGTSRLFAWQMFPETSTRHAEIVRITASGEAIDIDEPWPGGYRWSELVAGTGMENVTDPGPASYGVAVTTDRLQRTIDWVAANTPEDTETVRIRATLWTSHNGRAGTATILESVAREPENGS